MTQEQKTSGLFGIKSLLKVILIESLLIGFMALLAGRWTWLPGWIFLGVYSLYSLALFGWLAVTDPDLLRERQRDADPRNEPYEKIILPLMVILELGLLGVSVLDGGRFGWSTVPQFVRFIGWLLLGVTGAILPWVFRTNTFASGVVRIQEDRDHQLIVNGPYRIVRHPMYAAVISGILGLPLALGSWWALIPAGLLIGLFVLRTALEDRTLARQFPDYKKYAQQTRYRLLPGIW
jgi:protein-S-isoprenylcysteine O-methyltransferase Ste14